MTTSEERYRNIAISINSFRDEHAPYAERFHDFIRKNDTRGYVDHSLAVYPEPGWDDLKFKDFDIIFAPSTMEDINKGISYRAYNNGWGDWFIMPYEYLDDPDFWEKSLMEQIDNDARKALETLRTEFPGLVDEDDAGQVEFLHRVERGTRYLRIYLHNTKKASSDSIFIKFNGKDYLAEGGLGYNLETGHIEVVTAAESIFVMHNGNFVPYTEV